MRHKNVYFCIYDVKHSNWILGTKLGYNTMLALRQLGYPIKEKPSDEVSEGFVLHDMAVKDSSMLSRIIHAWENVQVDGKPRNKRKLTEEPYTPWVKEKAKEAKLPFITHPSVRPNSPRTIPISLEEVDQMKATISLLEGEKEEFERKLQHLQ